MNVWRLREILASDQFGDDMAVYARDLSGSEWTLSLPYVEHGRVYVDLDMALLLLE